MSISYGWASNGIRVGEYPSLFTSENSPYQCLISREWSLLLPAYSIVLVLLTYFVYFSIAIARTPAFSELRTLVGE